MAALEFMKQYTAKPSRVKDLQKIYQSGPLPTHLKGRADISFYRLFMYGTSVGVMFTMYQFSQMALEMKRSRRSALNRTGSVSRNSNEDSKSQDPILLPKLYDDRSRYVDAEMR